MKKIRRFISFAISFGLAGFAASALADDLTGQVLDSNGKAIPEAHVFILTAEVKKGTSPYCPSCYPDCGKNAATGSDGKFVSRE